MFYLKLVEELLKLKLHKVHADGAIFSYVKEGKLCGLIVVHVDDLLMAGNDVFHADVTNKLQTVFKFSKILENDFKYCGCYIRITEEGVIELNQNEYIDNISFVERAEGDDDRKLTENEKKELKSKVGELLWVSLMTRPDLSFDVNYLSSQIQCSTVKTVKETNRIIKRAKSRNDVLRFVPLGPISKLHIKVYTDASFGNRDQQTKSTSGRVVMIENEASHGVNVLSWKTKKISRVCRSVKGAETRALEDGLDEAINASRIIMEIYLGQINLKKPAQLPVLGFTDSKSLWDSLHSTRQCEEKLLRNSVAGMKELMQHGEVTDVIWVPTDKQIADCMTKKGKKADSLVQIAKTNKSTKF